MRVVQYLDEPSALLQPAVVGRVLLHKITSLFPSSGSSSTKVTKTQAAAVARAGGEGGGAATARARAAAGGVFDLGLSLPGLNSPEAVEAASNGELQVDMLLEESRAGTRW